MSTPRRHVTSLFHPGTAKIQACTGSSPSALAICGFPPARSFGFDTIVEDSHRRHLPPKLPTCPIKPMRHPQAKSERQFCALAA